MAHQEQTGQVVVYGAGGFGREVLWILSSMTSDNSGLRVMGFVDDDCSLHGASICGFPVLGDLDSLPREKGFGVVLGVGEPRTKRLCVEHVRALKLSFLCAIDPSCRMSSSVQLGEGVVIAGGSILTTQVAVGRWVTVNLGCTVGHDATIGDYTTLAPGTHISGGVTLGQGVKLGSGSVVLPGVQIGDWSVVGAGAVVTRDLTEGVVAVGVPARVMRELEV